MGAAVKSAERHAEIRRLFLSLSTRPEKEHARLLDEACGSDVELRKEVEELLAYHTRRPLSWQAADVALNRVPASDD